ncbi:hypothetical protein HID58_087838 [Brassica napus]|uniref:Uncharacterized protein n=1 Tax=Brassica napus TaxID=3708 RepID=A0ABQ7XUF9_BRANA|nr:hypothetical protein HID58_087838 [Brassica napus]
MRQLCIQTFLTSINLSNDADSTEWIVAIGLSSRLEQLLNMAQPDPLKGQTDIMWLNGGPHLRPLQSGGGITLLSMPLQLELRRSKLSIVVWQLTNSLQHLDGKRNARILRQCFKPYTSIITTIDRTTCNCIHSKCDKNPGQSSQMIRFWFSLIASPTISVQPSYS